MALLTLGKNLYLPGNPDASLPVDQIGNTWLIGQTGKSTLLENLATQLAYAGIPFAFIDPLSTSVPRLLEQLPKQWHRDTVYLNPLSDFCVPWNPLEDLSLQQDKVASQMVSLLETMLESGSFLYRSQDLLKMSVLALQGIENATLLHIPKLLTDDQWRRYSIAPTLGGPVRDFWDEEYEQWIKERERSAAIAALMNKVRIFTTSSPLKDILCAKERITPRQITQGKILLADIHGTDLGQLETTVLCSLLLARLNLATCKPYIVLIDNVEYISHGILESALANPHLYVIMAHIHGTQVDMDAVMAHAQNIFAFQVNTTDARQLEQLFPEYVQARHLVDQRPYTCYVKQAQNVYRLETFPPYAGTISKTAVRIRTQSAQRYARARTAVHAYLRSVAA
jgi:hypothetical protein